MTHEELDRLFRANAERDGFAPAPGEWEEMTAMLEADERRERRARWVSAAWGALFVALIAAGVWGAIAYAPAPDPSGEPARGGFPVALQTGGAAFAKTLNPAAVTSTAAADVAVTDVAVAVTAVAQPPTRQTTEPKPPAGFPPPAPAGALEALERRGGKGAMGPEEAQAPAGITQTSGPGATAAEDFARAGSPSRITRLPSLPAAFIVRAAPAPGAIGVVGPVDAASQRPPRWALSLAAVAEATQVEMDSPLAYGYRVGPRVSFRLNDRVRVSAAALIGRRGYRAAHDQTTMSPELFVDRVMPAATHGRSAIVEVPIGLSYYPGVRRGPRWFVNVALSSYRLLSDEMTFTYAEHRAGQMHSMVSEERDQALAANLRLGGGLALDWFGGARLEVGPYLQLPLRSTSYSEVALYSAGVTATVPVFAR